jgi:hypothetical protein
MLKKRNQTLDMLKGEESNLGDAEGEELNPTLDPTKGGNNLEVLKERQKTYELLYKEKYHQKSDL